MGRPSEFSPEVANAICERLIEGESLRSICKADDMPSASTVCRWLGSKEEWADAFRQQYAHAREAQADTLFDEILDIADDASRDVKVIGSDDYEREVCNTEFVQRARLRVDARKWMAGKLAPKKYGEKVVQQHEGPDGGPVVVRWALAGEATPDPADNA